MSKKVAASTLLVFVVPLICLAQPSQPTREPGVWVRFYDIGETVPQLPDLVPGQAPNVVKVSPTINFDDARGDFGELKDNFVTEVTGTLTLARAGAYAFRLISDDGARLWIDDKLVIDHDGLHGPEPKDAAVELAAGAHPLRLRHFQGAGGAHLELQWKPPAAPGPDFVAVPAEVLSHEAGPAPATAPGTKRMIPPLRRGRPGDGTPVPGVHPAFTVSAERNAKYQAREDLRVSVIGAPPTQPPPAPVVWFPADEGGYQLTPGCIFTAEPYRDQILVGNGVRGEIDRFFIEECAGASQGCAFRFAAGLSVGLNLILTSDDGSFLIARHGARPNEAADSILLHGDHLVPSGQVPFEMLAVRAMSNGFEIEFTKPLDPRVGRDPESYYVEQWPFDVAKGKPPTRDGRTTPVKSASVAPDRRRVFLEVGTLKPSHVIYLRLLPPCLSEDGQLPWSTEAWYTLHALPKDRPGKVLPPPPKEPQNILSDAERQAGWRLLFDGQTTKGWHGYRMDSCPDGWKAVDGCLARVGPGGDIISDEAFDSFELAFEWRISAAGNSGVFFRVDEQLKYPWESAPEYQILDNAEHADGRSPLTSAASNYALYAPVKDATLPVGLFNQARIIVKGRHVEHWLNGVKVVAYELLSPEWEKLVAESKFSKMPSYGRAAKGHIDLQDHGDKVWYRNIKIRPLKAE
jgi:hypothetical protein